MEKKRGRGRPKGSTKKQTEVVTTSGPPSEIKNPELPAGSKLKKITVVHEYEV